MLARSLGEGDQLVPQPDRHRGAISSEVAAARRAGAMALMASAMAFALVATTAWRSRGFGEAAVVSDAAHRSDGVVGLLDAGVVGGALQDLVDNFEKAEAMHPAAHRIKVPGSALYLDRSPIAEKYRDLPAGSTVFPVKRQGGWVELVVPEQDGLPPAMGWAPAPRGVEALLAAEPRPRTGDAHRASAISPEGLQRKWERARTRNGELKGKIADFQDTMKTSTYKEMPGVEERRHAAQAIAGEVKSGVSKLQQEVKKELRSGSAKQILSDLSKAFS